MSLTFSHSLTIRSLALMNKQQSIAYQASSSLITMVTGEEASDPTYLQWLLDAINKVKKGKSLACLDRILHTAQRDHQNWSQKSICQQLELAVRDGKVLSIYNGGNISYRDPASSQNRRFTVTPFTDLYRIIARAIRELDEAGGSTVSDIETYIHTSHVLILEDGADVSYLLKTSIEKAVRLGKLFRKDDKLSIANTTDTADSCESQNSAIHQVLSPIANKKMSKNQITSFFKTPSKESPGAVKPSLQTDVTRDRHKSKPVSEPRDHSQNVQNRSHPPRTLSSEFTDMEVANTTKPSENVNSDLDKENVNDKDNPTMISFEDYLKMNDDNANESPSTMDCESSVKEVETDSCSKDRGDEKIDVSIKSRKFSKLNKAQKEKSCDEIMDKSCIVLDTEKSSVCVKDENDVDKTIDCKPKSLGITKFFCKVDKNRTSKNIKRSPSETVVVTADIHPTPVSPLKLKPSKSFSIFDKQRCRSAGSNAIVLGDELDVIDNIKSEVIQVDEYDGSVKSKLGKDYDKITEEKNAKEGVDNRSKDNKKMKEPTKDEKDGDVLIVHVDNVVGSKQEQENKEKMKAKLDALDNVKVPTSKNATQATLNFSQKTGLKVKASAKMSEKSNIGASNNKKDADLIEMKQSKSEVAKKKLSKSSKNSSEIGDETQRKKRSCKLSQSESQSTETPVLRRSSRRHSPGQVETLDHNERTPPRKKRSKLEYTATILDDQNSKKYSPIRIRFTRLKHSRNEDGGEFTPKSLQRKEGQTQVKLSKAQELLQKAKSKKKKGKATEKTNRKSITPSPGVRRSGRRSSVQPLYDESILVCDDESESDSAEQKKRTNRKNSPVKTPRRGTKEGVETPKGKKTAEKTKGSPKKRSPTKKPASKGKIASIFQKGKPKKKDEEDDDVQIIQAEIDPEAKRIRQAFLFSGVPDAIRRQTAATSSVAVAQVADYPSLSLVRHIQQLSDSDQTIAYSPKVTLNLRPDEDKKVAVHGVAELGEFTDSKLKKMGHRMSLIERSKNGGFSEDTIRYLLAEVCLNNPGFPIRRTYRHLLGKFKGCEQENLTTIQQGDITGKKRKANAVEEIEPNSQRNPKRRKGSSEVIETKDGECRGRRSLRRTARNQVKEDNDETPQTNMASEDGKEKEKSDEVKGQDLMWTEKYQPANGNEVLGNTSAVKKLRHWLVEWKQLTDREARKQRKLLKKQAQKDGKDASEEQASSEWWADDDSDFDMSTSDEESDYKDEEEGKCNTMLITGPHGCGKTASVYALAQELGYKVFEVNASSRRSGRQILSQLQEATQSHQVARGNLDSTFTTFMQMAAKEKTPKAVQKKPEKLPTAFTNFFKKAGNPTSVPETTKMKTGVKEDKNPKPKNRVKAKDKVGKVAVETTAEDSMKTANHRGLSLCSTSLILFEEVDIVFEEDKGFWAAIQTFMSITKKPIVLTVNDPAFREQFEGRFETLTFKTPSPSHITSLLQAVCLVENFRTEYKDILRLVNINKGDMRRSFLSVQFWAESGGGSQQSDRPIKYNKDKVGTEGSDLPSTPNAKLQRLIKLNSNPAASPAKDSADEFEVIPHAKRQRFNRIFDDESSMDSMPGTPLKQVGSCGYRPLDRILEDTCSGLESSDAAIAGNIAEVAGPIMHCKMMESLVGAGNFLNENCDVLEFLRQKGAACSETDRRQQYGLVRVLTSLCADVMRCNLHHLLTLPVIETADLTLKSLKVAPPVAKPARRRIIQSDDLYDSETSNDGFLTLSKTADSTRCDGINVDPMKPSSDSTPTCDSSKTSSKSEERILHESVSSLADMYDTLSFTDCYMDNPHIYREGDCVQREFSYISAVQGHGLVDQPSKYDDPRWWKQDMVSEAKCILQLESVKQCSDVMVAVTTKVNDLPEMERLSCRKKMSLPVGKGYSDGLQLHPQCALHTSLTGVNKKCISNVASNLPLHVQSNRIAMATDYMPMLRCVCKSEQFREATHAKRRFFHYLDSISLAFKQSSIDVLCSSFT